VNDPLTTTPIRRPGWVRRTTSTDLQPLADGGLRLDGSARDLRTEDGGDAVTLAAASVTAVVDGQHQLRSLSTVPTHAATTALLGHAVGRGFRSTVHELLPTDLVQSTLLGRLLDELPVAVLISGYGRLYSGELGMTAAEAQPLQADICAGWRSDGTMLVTLRESGTMPVPMGPEAPSLTTEDADAWHALPTLPAGAMRRQRLLEVGPGTVRPVYAMFRDSHADESTGTATVLHEYSLTASFDAAADRLLDVEAHPQVLPWGECPAAAASAQRVSGRSPHELREVVRAELRGTSTCTHLNDLLRSLADVPALTHR
jgi:hypothetical protein